MNHSHSSSVSVMQRAKPNVNHLFRSKVYVNNFFIKYTSAHNKLMSTYFPLFFVYPWDLFSIQEYENYCIK